MRLDTKSNEEKQTVALSDQSSEFLFQNVLPGKYRLEVLHCFLITICLLKLIWCIQIVLIVNNEQSHEYVVVLPNLYLLNM